MEPEVENDILEEQPEENSKDEASADSGDEDGESEDSDDDDDEEDEEMIHKNDTSLDNALKKFNFLKNEEIEEDDDEEEDEDEESNCNFETFFRTYLKLFSKFQFKNDISWQKGGIEDPSLSPSSSKISDDVNTKSSNGKIKKAKLSNGVKKEVSAVANDSDDSADLDDDTMMKLDEALAKQFKLRKKDKKHESFILQYKLRALDFIQELLKTTYRLDLITVRIQFFLSEF